MKDGEDLKGSFFDEGVPAGEAPEIVLSQDNLSASVIIPPNAENTDIFMLLDDADITYGIDAALVEELNEKLSKGEKLEQEYVVAKGSRPVFGQHGELILRTNRPEDVILSSEDLTRVDYKVYKKKLLALAEEEKPVAMVIDPTEGADGMDVKGGILKGLDGDEVNIIMGDNVYRSGRKLVSRIDGLIEYKKNRDGTINFDISEVYLVKGDVDFTTGNISFPGSVIVKGIIKAGFEVSAKNEVVAETIRGDVITEGNVVAKQGIIGGVSKAKIKAKGSVYSKFVQNAEIISDESVEVKKSILSSDIYAEVSVKVDGSPGAILASSIYAVESVEAKIYGSESFVKTEVALYKSARDVITLRKAIKERFEISKNLGRIDSFFGSKKKKLFEGMDGDKQELVNKLSKKREELRSQLLEKNSELKVIQFHLKEPMEGRIIVGKEVWPEVRASISGKFILLKNKRKKGYFYYDKSIDNIEYKE